MFIDSHPFPHLDQSQFAGVGCGDIIFLDESIPDNKKEWLRKEYKKWWEERQDELSKTGRT